MGLLRRHEGATPTGSGCFKDVPAIHQYWWRVPTSRATGTMIMGMMMASNRLDETTTKDVEGYLAHVKENEKRAGKNHIQEEDEKVGSASRHEDEVVELERSLYHSPSAENRIDPDPASKNLIAWDSSCVVVKLQGGSLFVYAPGCTDEDMLEELRGELGKLGEVKLVFVYSAHTTGIVRFQQAFPDAVYFSDASWARFGAEKFPDFRMDFILPPTSSTSDLDGACSDGSTTSTDRAPNSALTSLLRSLRQEFDWHYGVYQMAFFHRSSGAFIGGDLVYKTCNGGAGGAPPGQVGFSCSPSCAAGGCDGPGGANQPAATPAWHARALQQAFFDPAIEADNLLPSYALPGGALAWNVDQAATALGKFQEWRPRRLACLHVPPLEGEQKVTKVLQSTFGWAVEKQKLSKSVGGV